jgi:hypothetical protein
MKSSLKITALGLLCGFLISSGYSQDQSAGGGWVQIFNGTNLDGWTPKFRGSPMGVNYKNTFHVTNGLLVVDYSQYTHFNGEFGHLFWKEKLSHYRIRAEYRFVGEQCPGGPTWGFRNNRIMIFSEPPETMELNQDFPASIEVQLLGGGNPHGDQNNGSFCTPHTRALYQGELTSKHRTSAREKIYPGRPVGDHRSGGAWREIDQPHSRWRNLHQL